MTKHKKSRGSERAGPGSERREGGRGGVTDRAKALNPAPATVCAFTVCSKGSRHNNLHSRATLENQRGEVEGQIVVGTVRGDGSRERGGWVRRKKKKDSGVAQSEQPME